MRITQLHATPVAVPLYAPRLHFNGVTSHLERILIELHTDEGIVGLGEVGNRTTLAEVQKAGELIRGLSIWDLEKASRLLAGGAYPSRRQRMVLAGVEMALLDLQGKVAGCSVAELLGGKLRTAIPTTAYVFRRSETADRQAVDSPSAITDLCAELIDRYGFQTIKLKAGAVPWQDDVAAARALRDRFPDHCLRVDPNGMWNISAAFRAASMMRELSLEWLEDPVDSAVGMAQLTKRMDIATATNMCLTWPGELPAAVAQRAVDVVLLDIWFSGGIRAARNFGLACAAWQLGIGLHSAGGGTSELGVGTAAMLHLAASLPALEFAADSMYHDVSDDVIAAPFRYGDGGALILPGGTGLGVELDYEKVEKWSCGDRIAV